MIAHSSVYRFVVPLSLVSLIMKTVQHQAKQAQNDAAIYTDMPPTAKLQALFL